MVQSCLNITMILLNIVINMQNLLRGNFATIFAGLDHFSGENSWPVYLEIEIFSECGKENIIYII